MCARLVQVWVLALCLAGRAVCAQRGVQQAAVLEPVPIENIQQGRHALQKWEEQATAEGGVMNIVFGNTCFTTAIAQMKQGCTKMDSTNRCWLAIQFTMCFQRASGLKALDCPTVCSKYRRLQACVEDCTAKMDSNSYTTYTHFYSDVFNMCLFLQTQNFQEFTTALVQDMHLSSVSANTTLGAIKTDLADQRQAVMQSLQAMAGLKEVQQDVAAKVREGLSEVQKVGQMSVGLQHSMNTSLEMTDALAVHQLSLLSGFSNLSQLHRQHVEEAAAAWQQLKAGAAALEHRQLRYEALQAQLLNASEGLLGQQQGMSSLLEVLIHYQHTGSSLLNHLYTSSTTLQDVMFYIISLSVPLLFVTHPLEARLLLLLAVLVSWVTERSIIQQLVPIHHSFSGHSGAGGQHSAAAAAAAAGVFSRTPGHIHGVKMGVRFVVLGGCCGLVMWWMINKELARRKKEEIFEEIRKSFAESDNFHRAYPAPPYHMPSAQPAAARQHMTSHTAAVQHHPMINAAAPAAATAGSSPATTATSTARRRKAATQVEGKQMPAPPPPAAVRYQPDRVEALNGSQHTHLPLIAWMDQHNPMHALFSSNHHAHPSLIADQMQQQQEEGRYSPAAAGTGQFVSPHSPGVPPSPTQQQQQQQLQGLNQCPADTRAQYAEPVPGRVHTAAAAAEEDSVDAHARQIQVQQQQQDDNGLAVASNSTRRRNSNTAAPAAAAAGSGKSRAAGKRGRAAAAVDPTPEEGDAAEGAEDTVGHAAKRPAGRKTRRQ